MLQLTNAMNSLVSNRAHRFATCWKIRRTDQVVLRFTDHNYPITLPDDGQYTPLGGYEASAVQKQTSLSDSNRNVRGMLSSAKITVADLVAGKYREAEITEQLVDWRYAFAGYFSLNKFWISEVRYNGENWQAELGGVSRWFRSRVGNVFSRACRYDLGDVRCGVDLESFRISPVVVTTATSRSQFSATAISVALADDYFNFGEVEWVTGDNAGLISEVKDYVKATRTITLYLPVPYDITTSDTFTAVPGCNKLFESDCIVKYSNGPNNGGQPYLPGKDKTDRTPGDRAGT